MITYPFINKLSNAGAFLTKNVGVAALALGFAFIPIHKASCEVLCQEQALVFPDWMRNQVVYELNVRQFSEEGTFKGAEAHLERLHKLGINTIWFMPVQPYGKVNSKSELGSYYSIADYTGINPEYGNAEDFKSFVDKAHALGMRVILDWVPNHTSWDNPLTITHPEFYARDCQGNFTPPTGTDWTDVIQLDFDAPGLVEYQFEAMSHWLDTYGLDGFRCDVAWNVPTKFWDALTARLRAHKPDIFMLAEAEIGEQMLSSFNTCYGWDLLHTYESVAQGRVPASAIDSALERRKVRFPAGASFLNMTSNHDENSWNGTVFERFGAGAKTFAVLAMTMDGVPLIYNGQEAGLDKRLEFFVRDPIEWKDSPMKDFYRRVIALKSTSAALLTGAPTEKIPSSAAESVYAYMRGEEGGAEVLVVANLTARNVDVELGSLRMKGEWTDAMTGEKATLEESLKQTLKSWEYLLYYR